MTQAPQASIIIRTKNEGAFLERTLTSVFAQRFSGFEVIVVDSGSNDDTLEIAGRFPTKILRIAPSDFTYGRALNLGIGEAKGKYVVSLSAHALPLDRDWLGNMLAPFSRDDVAGVAGKALPHSDCNPFDRRGLRRRFGTDAVYLHHDSSITFSNANAAIRKSVWEIAPFDESLPYSEDLLWSRQRMRQGWRFVYQPTATVYHSHNETPRQLFDRFYNESKARTQMGYQEGRFRVSRLLFDVFAGSIYDALTALVDHRSISWALFGLKRRYWINFGRYFGSRSVDKKFGTRPMRTLALRMIFLVWGFIGREADRLSPKLLAAANKDLGPVHPRELIGTLSGESWFLPWLNGAQRTLLIGIPRPENLTRSASSERQTYALDHEIRRLTVAQFLAKWEEAPNVKFMRGDAAALPFADKSLDRVVALDWAGQARQLVAESRRILKDQGLLLLQAPNADTAWNEKLHRYGIRNGDGNREKEKILIGEMEELGFDHLGTTGAAIDSPWLPAAGIVGGFSLSVYKKILERFDKNAEKNPERATQLKMVFKKRGTK